MIENLWVMDHQVQNRDMDYESFRFWLGYVTKEGRLDLVCELVEKYPDHMEQELLGILKEAGIDGDRLCEEDVMDEVERQITKYLRSRFGIDL